MKRIMPLILLIGFMMTVSSCVTKRQYGSWQEYPAIPFFYRFKIDKVSVIIDHVREENIMQQLFMIAETYLESRQNHDKESDKTLLLEINVEQRSFMQNVEMYNSIYVSCIARDDEGTVYARENEYISGKQTFIAAAEQNTIITRILNRLLSNQQKRYKDIQVYEKNMSDKK